MEIVIIGCGGHGRIVAETIRAGGEYKISAFADDDQTMHGKLVDGISVVGQWKELPADRFCVAVGDNGDRKRIFEQVLAAARFAAKVVSPRAYVSPAAAIGEGTVVLAGAVVQAGAAIGRNVIINCGAVVDHDAVVGDHAHVGANATVASFGVVKSLETLPAGLVRHREL